MYCNNYANSKPNFLGAYVIFLCVFITCGITYFTQSINEKTKILDFNIDRRVEFILPSSFNQNKLIDTKSFIGSKYILAFITPDSTVHSTDYENFIKLTNQGIDIYAVSTSKIENENNIFKEIAYDDRALVSEKMLMVGAPEFFLVNEYGIIEKHYKGHINQKIIDCEILPFFESNSYLAHTD